MGLHVEDALDNMTWTSISLICVEYPKGDTFGHLLAYISLLPFAIIVSFVTLCCYNRDLPTIFFFAGQLMNEAMNLVLKRTFKHQRPFNPHQMIRRPHNYGMPSQHCQFMSFYTTYCYLYLIYQAKSQNRHFKMMLICVLIGSLFAVIYSRIYLLYHFHDQCIVGTIIGSIWGFCWFKIVNGFCINYFPWIKSWKISQALGIQTWEPDSSKKK